MVSRSKIQPLGFLLPKFSGTKKLIPLVDLLNIDVTEKGCISAHGLPLSQLLSSPPFLSRFSLSVQNSSVLLLFADFKPIKLSGVLHMQWRASYQWNLLHLPSPPPPKKHLMNKLVKKVVFFCLFFLKSV